MTATGDGPYGPEIEQFYARIGRVVTAAALMKLWLLRLACVFESSPGEVELAGTHGSELVRAGITQLGTLSPELEARAKQVLDDASVLIEARNAIVHNVWPAPGHEYGHHPVRKKKRREPAEWIDDGFISGDDLDQLYGDLTAMVERLMDLRQRIDNEQRMRRRLQTSPE